MQKYLAIYSFKFCINCCEMKERRWSVGLQFIKWESLYFYKFLSFILLRRVMSTINPFVPNAPFLYPLKTFQGVEKGCIGNEWVNWISTDSNPGFVWKGPKKLIRIWKWKTEFGVGEKFLISQVSFFTIIKKTCFCTHNIVLSNSDSIIQQQRQL